jgi:signal transduction histidine kinase
MSRWVPAALILATPCIAMLGAAAAWAAYGPDGYLDPWLDAAYPWILDLLTGYVFLAAGVTVGLRRTNSLIGPLLVFTSVAWFMGTLVEPSRFVGTELAPSVVFLYRGPLFHAIVTFPSGRPADRVEWTAVLLGYASSLAAPLWFHPLTGIALVGLLVAVTLRAYRRAGARTRPARREALGAALLLATTVGVITAGRALDPPYPFNDVMTIGFHVVLMAIALRLTLRSVRSDRPELTDVVVELAGGSTATLGAELSQLLGDPAVRIGTWDSQLDAYVDDFGSPFSAASGSERSMVRVDQDGRALALVEHAPGTLDDIELREAVVDAVRLAVANTRLRAQVRAQVDELAASRRRLVAAGDAEGERLAGRLRDGAMRQLEAIDGRLQLAAATAAGAGSNGTLEAIERAQLRLGRLTDDLHDFALGLDPRPLTEGGLRAALSELGHDCPFAVDVHCDVDSAPREVATAAFLVCAEALANATKHSRASHVRIETRATAGLLHLSVTDDGIGGAAVGAGHGLRNMADRVASIGGRLSVDSAPNRGTRLAATMPLPVDTHNSVDAIPTASTDATLADGP